MNKQKKTFPVSCFSSMNLLAFAPLLWFWIFMYEYCPTTKSAPGCVLPVSPTCTLFQSVCPAEACITVCCGFQIFDELIASQLQEG
jgi:hypothetical protein